MACGRLAPALGVSEGALDAALWNLGQDPEIKARPIGGWLFGATGGDFCHGLLQPELMGPFRPGPCGWLDQPIPAANTVTSAASVRAKRARICSGPPVRRSSRWARASSASRPNGHHPQL